MVIEPHMKQGRQHKLISTIFLATSVTKKLDHNKVYPNLLLTELNVTGPMQCVVSDMTAFYVEGI